MKRLILFGLLLFASIAVSNAVISQTTVTEETESVIVADYDVGYSADIVFNAILTFETSVIEVRRKSLIFNNEKITQNYTNHLFRRARDGLIRS
jgi:acyl-CoA thioesterase FadM